MSDWQQESEPQEGGLGGGTEGPGGTSPEGAPGGTSPEGAPGGGVEEGVPGGMEEGAPGGGMEGTEESGPS